MESIFHQEKSLYMSKEVLNYKQFKELSGMDDFEEWLELILEAREIGLTVKEIEELFKSKRNEDISCKKSNTVDLLNITLR